MRLARQRQHVRLTIADDGVGMRLSDRAKPQSFGIRGMAERASALGGSLSLMDGPDGGTVVNIKIRLATPREAIIAAAASAPAHSGPP
ncbi:nitrate/nitrite sensor protein NarQ [compost metagenome]